MSDGAVSTVGDINKTLAERGKYYGSFRLHAQVTQTLLEVFSEHMRIYNLKKLTTSQREAVHMIMHKLGRIANGDPNYADSWVDIAGYAKLIADELQEKEEFNKKK